MSVSLPKAPLLMPGFLVPPTNMMAGKPTQTLESINQSLSQFHQEWLDYNQQQLHNNTRMQIGVTARYTLLLVLLGMIQFLKPSRWKSASLFGAFGLAGLSVGYMDWLVYKKYSRLNQSAQSPKTGLNVAS